MADNVLKTPLSASLNRIARGRALDTIQLTGKSLPCSVVSVKGAVVQVKFEIASSFTLPNVTVPVAGSIYSRDPIQPGDKGVMVPSDAYLGGVSGLGGGTADLSQRANLSALVFHAVGHSNWPASVDPMKQQTQGPNGVVLRDMGGRVSAVIDGAAGTFVITVGATVYTFSAAGLVTTALGRGAALSFGPAGINVQNGGVQVEGGEVQADGHTLKQHRHVGRGAGNETDEPTG